MENWLTVPFVILIYLTYRWFRFSNVSYGLVFTYMMLHIYGSHYTYAEVPFGFWMQSVLGLARNHYDRIVHFSFGLLLAYPVREVVIRISDTKGFWSYWFPIEFVLAFSAVYELLEWGIAVIFGGDLGVAYLGSQGDVWDAQKDMFVAGSGSVLAMLAVAIIIWRYRRADFWRELRESFTVKNKRELGEVALEDMRNNARSRDARS
jgi:putative membrane protein